MFNKITAGRPAMARQAIAEMSKAERYAMYTTLKRSSALGFMLTPGELEERIQTAGRRFAYQSTPFLTGATGVTGISAAFVDTLFNTALTTPDYVKAFEEAGGFTEDFMMFAIPQLAMDIFMARTTRGHTELYRSDLMRKMETQRVQMLQDNFGMTKAEATAFMANARQNIALINRLADEGRVDLDRVEPNAPQSLKDLVQRFVKDEKGSVGPFDASKVGSATPLQQARVLTLFDELQYGNKEINKVLKSLGLKEINELSAKQAEMISKSLEDKLVHEVARDLRKAELDIAQDVKEGSIRSIVMEEFGGLRPYRDKSTGERIETEEYRDNVPQYMRRVKGNKGIGIDEAAERFGMTDSEFLKAVRDDAPFKVGKIEDYYGQARDIVDELLAGTRAEARESDMRPVESLREEQRQIPSPPPEKPAEATRLDERGTPEMPDRSPAEGLTPSKFAEDLRGSDINTVRQVTKALEERVSSREEREPVTEAFLAIAKTELAERGDTKYAVSDLKKGYDRIVSTDHYRDYVSDLVKAGDLNTLKRHVEMFEKRLNEEGYLQRIPNARELYKIAQDGYATYRADAIVKDLKLDGDKLTGAPTTVEKALGDYRARLERLNDRALAKHIERLNIAARDMTIIEKAPYLPGLVNIADEVAMKRGGIDKISKVDRATNVFYPGLTARESNKVDKLAQRVAREALLKQGDVSAYRKSTDKNNVVRKYFVSMDKSELESNGGNVPDRFVSLLLDLTKNPNRVMTVEDYQDLYNAHLLYIRRNHEKGKIRFIDRYQSIDATRARIVSGLVGRQKVSDREVKRIMKKQGVDKAAATVIAAEKKASKKGAEEFKAKENIKRFVGVKQLTLSRLALDVEGKTYRVKDLLHDKEMPELYKFTMDNAHRAYTEKFKLLQTIYPQLYDLNQKYINAGEDVRSDGLSMSKRSKQVNWDTITLTHPDNTVKQIRLMPAEKMDLYMLVKDIETRDFILKHGIAVKAYTGTEDLGQWEGRTYKVNEADINRIINSLTLGQRERADYIHRLYQTTLRDFVNETVYDALGYMPAIRDNYTPWMKSIYDHVDPANARILSSLKDARAGMPKVEMSEFGTKTFDMMGIMQHRTKAKGPLLLDDAYRKVVKYTELASQLPFIRVYNDYIALTDNKDFKVALDAAGGKAYREQIDENMRLIASMQLRHIGEVEKLAHDFYVKFQQAKLGFSPWIPPIQGISLLYAMAEIPAKYHRYAGAGLTSPRETFREIKEYSPVNGYGRLSLGIMSQGVGDIYDYHKLSRVLTGKQGIATAQTAGIRHVDSQVMRSIWEMLKAMVRAERPDLTTKDAQLRKVAEMYDMIVNTTQPTHLPHTRGALTMAQDPIMRGLSMFFSQRNKIYNELLHIPLDFLRSERKVEDATNAIYKMGMYALVGPALLVARDEIRDLFYMRTRDWETRARRFAGYLTNNIVGVGALIDAWLSKVEWGHWSKYSDIDVPILSWINDVLSLGVQGKNVIEGLREEDFDQEAFVKSMADMTQNLVNVLDPLLGIGVANIFYFSRAAARQVSPEIQFLVDNMDGSATATTYYSRFWDILEKGETKTIRGMFDAEDTDLRRAMILLMDEDFLGKDMNGLESSYTKLVKNGSLPDDPEVWFRVADMYNELAEEFGWEPYDVDEFITDRNVRIATAELLDIIEEGKYTWKSDMKRVMAAIDEPPDQMRTLVYEKIAEAINNSDKAMFDKTYWLATELLGAEHSSIESSMRDRNAVNPEWGIHPNYVEMIEDSIRRDTPYWQQDVDHNIQELASAGKELSANRGRFYDILEQAIIDNDQEMQLRATYVLMASGSEFSTINQTMTNRGAVNEDFPFLGSYDNVWESYSAGDHDAVALNMLAIIEKGIQDGRTKANMWDGWQSSFKNNSRAKKSGMDDSVLQELKPAFDRLYDYAISRQ